MTEIRPATSDDLDGIVRVSSFLGYAKSSQAEAQNRLQSILQSDSDFVWVYKSNNKICGWIHVFVALRLASPGFAEIGGLVVDPECRRQGIGRQLVAEAIDWSTNKQLSIRVRCNSKRAGANLFYENLGFENSKTQNVHELRHN